jgi:hypothetical protein
LKRLFSLFFFLVLCVLSIDADGYPLKTPAKKVISEIKTYNWTSAKGWFEGETKKIVVEHYDEGGRLVSAELFYQKMTLIEKTVYSYEDGLVKKTITNHKNIPIRQSLVQHEGKKVTETVSRADGSLFYKTISLLDGSGRIKEQKYYNGEDEFVYDKVYDYTDKGDVKSISLHNPDGTFAVKISIYYESFDERGNWLRRSEYYSYADVRGRPRDSVHRKIEY